MKHFAGSRWPFGTITLQETRRILAKLARKSPEDRQLKINFPLNAKLAPMQAAGMRNAKERGLA